MEQSKTVFLEDTDNLLDFATNLKIILAEFSISNSELSASSEVSENSLSRIISDNRRRPDVRVSTVKKLALGLQRIDPNAYNKYWELVTGIKLAG